MAKLKHVAEAGRPIEDQKRERRLFVEQLKLLVSPHGRAEQIRAHGRHDAWVAKISVDGQNLMGESVSVHVKPGVCVALHQVQALYDRTVELGQSLFEMPDYALESFELVMPGRKR